MRRLLSICVAVALFAYLAIFLFRSSRAPYVDRNAPPIVIAAQRGNLAEVKRIVAGDPAAIYHTDSNRHTAAACAILDNQPEIAKYLIEAGYPVNPRSDSEFPLIMACLSRYSEESQTMLKYLLDKGADPNVTYKPAGWIPLNMAVNNGQEENVKLLAQYGAKLDSKDETGQTSLEMAKQRLALFKNPRFDLPHGEFSDPLVRQQAVDAWDRMVRLLVELEERK